MSTEEDIQRCPLCVEEMDWTDQQFKPCKCGYQICVWCWHRIMDMADNDVSEGRCPACRTIYHKDEILAMQVDCDRRVTAAKYNNNNSNKQSKPPTANRKSTDHSNIRVIQRKIAYVMGLPISLADEEILQRTEFFGQYGNISKISLSRTAGGAIQRFINGTRSVYVTYTTEEEALRCIQSVHGFVLDGRILKASFGTAKYCHAWLRNIPCSNPNCLFLHAIGADEDCFGKDEVATVHTRIPVKAVAGSSNSSILKSSGNVLPPPPVEELPNNSECASENLTAMSSSNDSAQPACCPSNGGKMTTSVDAVGPNPSSSSGSEKDENSAESNRRILDLCSSDGSSVVKEPSSDYLLSSLLEDKGSNGSCIREEAISSDDFLLKDSSKLSQGILNDKGNELKSQPFSESDQIYLSSNSLPKEEIAKHLRRMDDDDNSTDDAEKDTLDAVERSLMSLYLDSFDDSFALPQESGFCFPRRNGLAGASLNNLGQMSNTKHYLSNPQHQASRPSPSLAPFSFSLPSREAPPGFSGFLNTCSPPSSLIRTSASRNNGSDYVIGLPAPATLSCLEDKPTNGLQIPGLNTWLASPNQQMGGLNDETRLWLLMQQQATANQASKYSQNFMPQTPSQVLMEPYPGLVRYDDLSTLSDAYGNQSRLMDKSQRYGPSSYGNLPQQMFGNGHISNGYPYGFSEVQRKNEVLPLQNFQETREQ